MPVVGLALSGLQDCLEIVEPLMPHVVASFSPFGIDIDYEINQVLTRDPEQVTDGWRRLTRTLQEQSNMQSPAHLVVTRVPPGYDGEIDGKLLDTRWRGVAAVYLDADLYRPYGPAQRPDLVAQICIHEIGHLFNLTHTDGSEGDYSNAMEASTSRLHQEIDIAWKAALVDATNRGESPLETPDPTIYYPFNAQCRANLRAATDDPRWLPFQGPFRGNFESAGANEDRSLDIEVLAHGKQATSPAIGALYATMRIRNRASFPIDLPAHLSPEHGTLQVIFEKEGMEPVHFRPRQIVCSSARRTLMPNQTIFRPLAFVGREEAPLFATPGLYRCTFNVLDFSGSPRKLLGRPSLEIAVDDEPACRQDASNLITAIEPGIKRRKLPAILDRRARPDWSAVRFHGVLATASRTRSLAERSRLFRMCLHPEAPDAIRHQAGKQLALQRIRKGEAWQKVCDELEASYSESLRPEFQNSVKRMGEGWIRQSTTHNSAPVRPRRRVRKQR